MADLRIKYDEKNFFGIHEYREDNVLNAEYDQFLKAMRYMHGDGMLDSALDINFGWRDEDGYYEHRYYTVYHDESSLSRDEFTVVDYTETRSKTLKMTYRQVLRFFRKYF